MKELFVKPLIVLGALDLLLVWFTARIVKLPAALQSSEAGNSPSSSTAIIYLSATVAGVAGLWFRLYGFDRSLWLDEFGTLWAVEGNFYQMWERVNAFQGQSPFYYSLAWLFVHLFGESEIILRLPSFILGVGTAYGAYLLGNLIEGRNVGLIAASLLWLSPSMAQASADARPYALASFTAVIMFYGFARAVQRGDPVGRCLFIIGGAALFSAHYVLILVALGIASGYIVFPRLRANYSVHQFALDVGLQLLLISWCVPHVIAFWNRRESLSWLSSEDYLVFFELIGPFIVLALAQFVSRKGSLASDFQRAMSWVLALAIACQIGALQLLAYFGTNLLHARYMIVIVPPAVLLAAVALTRIPRHLALIPLIYWLIFVVGVFTIDLKIYGSFSRAGLQDWRKAVVCLDTLLRDDPGAPVLYRSGFVEEDKSMDGQTTAATLSPLRSPGQQTVSWNLNQLTYSWLKPSREAYFAQTVKPAIHGASIFYYLSCAGCFDAVTVRYSDALIDWVEQTFPGRFQSEFIQTGQGMALIRFKSRVPVPGSASFANRPLSSYQQSKISGVVPSSHQKCGDES